MKKKSVLIGILTLFCTILLMGCGKNVATNQPAAASPTVETPTATATPTPEPTPKPKKEPVWDTEIMKNDTGKTLIKCITQDTNGNFHTSFGITSQNGTAIVTDPQNLVKGNGLLKADIITVSHQHSDHYDPNYLNKLKDIAKILQKPTKNPVTVNEVTITGVAASHTESYPNESNPSNIIFVFEVDGLRIAHMGDMGQTELNPEQLEKLGQLDIIMTVITHAPNYGSGKEKNIRIIQQLNPKIIIPTHYADDIAKETCEALGISEIETMSSLSVSKEELKDASMRYIILE